MPIFWGHLPEKDPDDVSSAPEPAEEITDAAMERWADSVDRTPDMGSLRIEKTMAILSDTGTHQVRVERMRWPDMAVRRYALHLWHLKERDGTTWWSPGKYISFTYGAAAALACILEAAVREDAERDATARLDN